ncbi:DUF1330 domain-containing protein [Rhodococcus pyridinivorans]|uniref:DUF1330 domain-containing protein n=1 Tax=Rhodococcus TaxID=1827 RepID=UPI000570473C|nr:MULTISPECIES: DUF1330 domain-containing protein [Rhodococcus]MCD2116539.1 DUF1330 domain-containing protein [Rhodococcus pyridinivorans]MCD5419018.1 DUF1330 domain-containing protein [Rhodococcus pyridinivorans]MCZ4625518.1 DUF1330 domain-containing protein [Rhodococcus pyridinivorans]MCZ4646728.1 DUF1330 domain-containing protein [Rhodococcus pyridinivorans]MDJ0482846.1 DUF1330 domain-containing protein [Rhodococcus pyridinivorans]
MHPTVEPAGNGHHYFRGKFPDVDRARSWYESPEYQAILPLRTENSEGWAVVVQGTPPGYRATHFLDKVFGAQR